MIKLVSSPCKSFARTCACSRLQAPAMLPNQSWLHHQRFSCAKSSFQPEAVSLNDNNANNVVKSSLDNLSSAEQLIHHLERTSLVDFDNAEAIKRLNEAINFANQLMEVNTDGVEPLVTILENKSLYLREDKPEPTKREDILRNASVTEEDYFVAPPGNIPLEPTSKAYLQSSPSENQASPSTK